MRKRLRVLRAHGPRVYCLLFWLLYYPINSKLIQWRYTAIQYAGSISSVGCSVVVIHAVTLAHVIKAFGKGFTHHNIIAPAHSLHSTPLDVTSGGHVRYTQHHIILFFFSFTGHSLVVPKICSGRFLPRWPLFTPPTHHTKRELFARLPQHENKHNLQKYSLDFYMVFHLDIVACIIKPFRR